MLTNNKLLIGHDRLTLSEMETTTVSAIEQGSIIEIGGALFLAESNESISTTDPHTSSTVANGTVYIFINGTTGLAYYTATAPTWDDDKQGWYGTAGYANYRYVPIYMTKSGSSYSNKRRFTLGKGLEDLNVKGDLSVEDDLTVGDDVIVTDNITADGFIYAANMPKFSGYGVSTLVAQNSSANLDISTALIDNRSGLGSDRYTIPETGDYLVSFAVVAGFANSSESATFRAQLWDGSSAIGDSITLNMDNTLRTAGSLTRATTGSLTLIKNFTSGTYIYVRGTNPSDGSYDAYANVAAISVLRIV